MKSYLCTCEDSNGIPHNILISKKEYEQDGMCLRCADQVWKEINSLSPVSTPYRWYHDEPT